MNKDRRKAITAAMDHLNELRSNAAMLLEAIEAIRDEEQEYFDNMPESLQDGDKGQRAQEAIDALENAHSEVDLFDFDSIEAYLQDAQA